MSHPSLIIGFTDYHLKMVDAMARNPRKAINPATIVEGAAGTFICCFLRPFLYCQFCMAAKMSAHNPIAIKIIANSRTPMTR